MAANIERYTADKEPALFPLAVQPHFDALGDKDKHYAHFISKAAMAGTSIVLRQVSPESEDIYKTIIALHRSCQGNYAGIKDKATDIDEDDMKMYLAYASQFLGNCGNYKSFGDTKFIPRLPKEKMTAIVKTSPVAYATFENCKDAMYSLELLNLGCPADCHMSGYYPNSPDITKAEVDDVQNLLTELGLLPENTRLTKTPGGDYKLLIASAKHSPEQSEMDVKRLAYELDGPATKGKKLSIVYGDHSKEMTVIADCMQQALEYSANDTQKAMHKAYVTSFETGSMAAHVESQRKWVKDLGPMVESNMGFIESYRDFSGTRAEWEGFAAMVNQETTKAFTTLVNNAPKFLPKLPWPSTFEKDVFQSPDFTSLEVLQFAGSGIPAGINIPNYDSVRQTEGFKNVSLGNTLTAIDPKQPICFIREEDKDLYKKHRIGSFEVQVGLHELLGHGSGKLFIETEKGKYNFDIDNPPLNPVTEKPISTWYKLGQTWGTVFGGTGPSYEECRAECVAMSLGCHYDVLHIFGFLGDDIHSDAGDVKYIMWLQMARAGIAALEFWDPKLRKWGQAHMQARFAIFQAMLSGGKDFCHLKYNEKGADDGSFTDIEIIMDRTKIDSHGLPAVDDLLKRLQIFKATADLTRGLELYNKFTDVDEWFATKIRPEVLRRKQPRKNFVQANTFVKDGKVELKEYPATCEGMIQSYADREYIF